MIYLVADTHGSDISDPRFQRGDTLIHLGDFMWGKLPDEMTLVLIRGNHDNSPLQADRFHLACDGLVLGNALLTHEPVERLPKGCHINICGHLHENHWPDYGFERKAFHRLLAPRRIYELDDFKYGRANPESK